MRPNLQHLQPTHATIRPRIKMLTATTFVVAVAAFASFATVPASAPATPLSDKQAAARALDAQVSKLEREYDALQERYRGANIELESVQGDVKQARVEVAATRRNLGTARVRLQTRAISIYRTGSSNAQFVDIAVSGSFSNFFDRLDAVERVGDQDADVLGDVQELNRRIEAKERALTKTLAKQATVVAKAKKAQARMSTVLDERQTKLASVNADIRQIMEQQRQEAARRAAERARESAALADTTGSRTANVAATGGGSSGSAAPASSGGESSGSGSDSGSSGISIPLPPGSSTAAAAANAAMGKLGSPYVWAGSGPSTFDCSGLVMWAFAQAGRPGLPHSTYALVNMGVDVPLSQLQVGDLVFPSHNGHVGIYVGGGSFVHAPSSGDVVKVTSMGDYSISHARRL